MNATSIARKKKITPVGKTFFYTKWPDEIMDAKKQAECICDTCFHCGVKTFEMLSYLFDTLDDAFSDVSDIHLAIAQLRGMLDVVQQMCEREFYQHCSLQSSTATHCLAHALGAPFGTSCRFSVARGSADL